MGHPLYTKKYNVSCPIKRSGEDETNWMRVGKAFRNRKSGLITLKLDAIPTARDKNGQVILVLFEDEED